MPLTKQALPLSASPRAVADARRWVRDICVELGREDLVDTYRAIGERYPGITVRVLAYPRLMQGNGRCDGVTGISGDEADWIDEQVDLLNHQIEVAAARARGMTGA